MFRSSLRWLALSAVLPVLIVLAAPDAIAGRTPAARAGASRSAPSVARHRTAGGSLDVVVTGLPAGHAGRIVVRGPKGFHRSLGRSVSLRHLAAGIYRVHASAIHASHGAQLFPTTGSLRARVTKTRGAVARVAYTTLVPRTTKAVSARSVKGIKTLGHGRRLVHLAGAPHLSAGDVIASGIGKSTPHGLLSKVVSVRSNGTVVVKPATLLEAIPTGALDVQADLADASEAPQALRRGLVYDDDSVSTNVDGKFGDCNHDVKASVAGSVSIKPSFDITANWSLFHGVTAAKMTANLTESSALKASIEAAADCSGKRDLFKKPITFAELVVDVGGIPIVISPQLQITFEGEAKVNAEVVTSASQSLGVTAGLQYARGHGVSPIDTITHDQSFQAPTVSASGSVEASVNPEVDFLIDGIGGPEVGLTGGLDLAADTSADPWWTLDGYLSGNAGVTIPLLHFDKRVELAKKTWKIAQASGGFGGGGVQPYIGVDPDVASAWSDSVCGFDDPTNLNNYFDLSGGGFQHDGSVSLSTDWTSYDSVTADDDGDIDADEPVGEVPDALGDYGVYAADGAGGSASTSIELLGDGCIYQTEDDGVVDLQWGGNGFDPDSYLSLSIDDEFQDDATTDDYGSGGDTDTSFECPDSGSYTWEVDGTVYGDSYSAEEDFSCDPADDLRTSGDGRTVAAAGQAAAVKVDPAGARRLASER